MEKKGLNNRNGGFSMVEMLAVVAIIVILLGISMVAVVRYRDLLKITELDNAAREIYMAAENRAVLLSGARRLNNQVDAAGENTTLTASLHSGANEDLYYVSRAGIGEELLTVGSIDPALRDGDFYIVYDKNSGSVTDVFYAEEPMGALVGGDFETFYDTWAKSRSERLKLKDRMLVGWYNGEAAEGRYEELDIPDEPTLTVMIKNEEELAVTVKYSYLGEAGDGELSVKLGNIELTGKYDRKKNENLQNGSNGVSYECTWVLDSLTAGQFKALEGSDVIPSGDFTVTATLTSRSHSFPAISAGDENNSLFQEGSGDETAYIKYLRHLQNLDSKFSGVTGKTQAVQTADIYCRGSEAYEAYKDYDFIPIYNSKLTNYDGRTKEIRNLYVSGTKFTGNSAHAGLFSRTSGGTSSVSMTFRNIRLVNASVYAAGSNYAGALVGSTSDATIQNCWVYWEPDGDVTDLRELLGSDGEGAGYKYQIKGSCAGSLVGYSKGNCTITGSLAATLINGTDCAGGLIGKFDGGSANITYSYADCYLTGDTKTAGLIGDLMSGKTANLKNCYAAGYIVGGSRAAGLCMGTGTTRATNVYSVMRFPNRESADTFYFLTENHEKDTFENTQFLGKESDQVSENLKSTSYADMTDENFAGAMGSAFEWKTSDNSHPYNLREHLTLSVYSFPGLRNLPHYGDWGAEFKEPSLVYYEQYSGDTWGVSGGNARDLIQQLSDNKTILSDGYAVAFLQEDLKAESVEVVYTYFDAEGQQQKTEPHKYKKIDLISTKWTNDDGSSADYYMICLPDDMVNSLYAQGCFYRYLKFELTLYSAGEQPWGEYFYNPHFAETVVPVISNEGAEGGWTQDAVTARANELAASMDEVKVRTPRHLYDLSRFKEYYTRRDTFRQILDLDYGSYTGYENKFQGTPFAQQPIGRYGEPFMGTYNGDCNTIKNVVYEVDNLTQRQYAGLFGYSTGTLRNIVYEMDPNHQVTAYLGSTAQNLYVGALVGGSSGTIDNCAVFGVNLRAAASTVNLYVGGLVGQNRGTVRNCAAESARLSANCFRYAKIYIGGLVGENAASQLITTSYAVGRIDAEIDTTVTTARICGFVGWNSGSIYNSYAAVDLRSSGAEVETYGFCGMRAGNQSGTFYLDQGNFVYREISYAANYHREGDKAVSTRYVELTDPNMAATLGMDTVKTGGDPETEYPYPTAVRKKDENGNLVPWHYGRWPAPMPLGEMGVFYWEKMVDAAGGGNPTYHISALAVDPGKNTITKQTTLSEAHNDGRVIVDYGYGYYEIDGTNTQPVKFEAKNIGYTDFKPYAAHNRLSYENLVPAKITEDSKEKEAREGLAALMPGFSFHCWNSYHEGGRLSNTPHNDRAAGTTSGLYLFNSEDKENVQLDGGTFKLTQNGASTIEVTFIIDPQFADAMSVKKIESPAQQLAVTGGASTLAPGTEKNPYSVRCGIQLQNLNWTDGLYTDVPMGFNDYKNVGRFPYLNDSTHAEKHYWRQTHDIDWTAEGNKYKGEIGVFMGIAQVKVVGTAGADGDDPLPGWFGGSYDGQNYTIKNLRISRNEGDGYEPNCMGLFGAVTNASLTNIVMYSETGVEEVSVLGRKSNSDSAKNYWYAGGILVGLALDSEISNCATAGYTIVDEVKYMQAPVYGRDRFNAIGGLVGMTNQPLEYCTAATTIRIANTYSPSGQNLPVMVGGLVGSTTSTVSNCYAGGSVTVSNQGGMVYAGGIVGGVGIVPVDGTKPTGTVKVSNCYSYTDLPQPEENHIVVSNIGSIEGAIEYKGTSQLTLDNNYYLSDKKGADISGERAITYRQLAGQENIDDGNIYNKLNNKEGETPYGPYYPVTSKVEGLSLGGRFSYAPRNRKDLQGLDYPFPTVLTQTRVSDGMLFHVHYGGWELQGIERENGGEPINLDMFTKLNCSEKLSLSEGIATDGWIWVVESGDEKAVKAEIDSATGELTVTAVGAEENGHPVEVTVRYVPQADAENIETYPHLTIDVYVTDIVELRPNKVSVFPNDVVSVTLAVIGRDPDNPNVPDEDRPVLDEGELTLSDEGVGSTDASLAVELLEPVEVEGQPARPVVALTSGEGFTGDAKVNVTYTYTQGGYSVTKTGQIDVALLDLPEGVWDEDGANWTMDFGTYAPTELTASLAGGALDGFTVAVSKENFSITLTKSEGAELQEDLKLEVDLTLDGLTHKLIIAVPQPEAEVEETGGGSASQSEAEAEQEPES